MKKQRDKAVHGGDNVISAPVTSPVYRHPTQGDKQEIGQLLRRIERGNASMLLPAADQADEFEPEGTGLTVQRCVEGFDTRDETGTVQPFCWTWAAKPRARM